MERQPLSIRKSQASIDGAGVRLRRAFGFGDSAESDPFLLLDDLRNDRSKDFIRGFPWHPHRGIETITYMLDGRVEHQDSMGNRGVIGAGSVQWMTAGRGIIHQEMPVDDGSGKMGGFQLWTNLPAKDKMMKPRYQDIESAAIPERLLADGSKVRVIAGDFEGTQGPVEGIVTEPEYFDLHLAPGADLVHRVEPGKRAFAYVFGGSGRFGEGPIVDNGTIVFFTDGDSIRLRAATDSDFRLLFCSGMGLGEPVAWRGPIVMNTSEELDLAFKQLERGDFII